MERREISEGGGRRLGDLRGRGGVGQEAHDGLHDILADGLARLRTHLGPAGRELVGERVNVANREGRLAVRGERDRRRLDGVRRVGVARARAERLGAGRENVHGDAGILRRPDRLEVGREELGELEVGTGREDDFVGTGDEPLGSDGSCHFSFLLLLATACLAAVVFT